MRTIGHSLFRSSAACAAPAAKRKTAIAMRLTARNMRRVPRDRAPRRPASVPSGSSTIAAAVVGQNRSPSMKANHGSADRTGGVSPPDAPKRAPSDGARSNLLNHAHPSPPDPTPLRPASAACRKSRATFPKSDARTPADGRRHSRRRAQERMGLPRTTPVSSTPVFHYHRGGADRNGALGDP